MDGPPQPRNFSDGPVVSGFIDELKDAKVFENRNYYDRLKKKIQAISETADVTVTDELIKELDNAVKNSGAYL